MKNKKGIAQFVIPPIVITLIVLYFKFWAIDLVISELEPEFEKLLNELEDKAVCPPEFSSDNYEICFTSLGEVIVGGRIENDIIIETDSGGGLTISPGNYDSQMVGTITNLQQIKNLYISGKKINKIALSSPQLLSYTKTLSNLRKPIKTGFFIWRQTKYIRF